MGDLKPGIYKATVRGVPDMTILVSAEGDITSIAPAVDGPGGDWCTHYSEHITEARPLIVLDLNDGYGGRANLAIKTLRDKSIPATGIRDVIAEQIEAQTKPPRIPEPGEFGVVEAEVPNKLGRRRIVRYVAESVGTEWQDSCGEWWTWEDLIDPVLVRDGVSA